MKAAGLTHGAFLAPMPATVTRPATVAASANWPRAIAQYMNLEPKELDDIRVGALLHDLGKIGIVDTDLQKPGSLTRNSPFSSNIPPSVAAFWKACAAFRITSASSNFITRIGTAADTRGVYVAKPRPSARASCM